MCLKCVWIFKGVLPNVRQVGAFYDTLLGYQTLILFFNKLLGMSIYFWFSHHNLGFSVVHHFYLLLCHITVFVI